MPRLCCCRVAFRGFGDAEIGVRGEVSAVARDFGQGRPDPYRGMIGEAQIIVRAQVKNRRAAADRDSSLLWTRKNTLLFVQACAFDLVDSSLQETLHLAVNNYPPPRL